MILPLTLGLRAVPYRQPASRFLLVAYLPRLTGSLLCFDIAGGGATAGSAPRLSNFDRRAVATPAADYAEASFGRREARVLPDDALILLSLSPMLDWRPRRPPPDDSRLPRLRAAGDFVSSFIPPAIRFLRFMPTITRRRGADDADARVGHMPAGRFTRRSHAARRRAARLALLAAASQADAAA